MRYVPNKAYSFAEILAMPWDETRAQRIEREAAEFRATCARAEAKGNRALELLRAPHVPTPGIHASDYEVTTAGPKRSGG